MQSNYTNFFHQNFWFFYTKNFAFFTSFFFSNFYLGRAGRLPAKVDFLIQYIDSTRKDQGSGYVAKGQRRLTARRGGCSQGLVLFFYNKNFLFFTNFLHQIFWKKIGVKKQKIGVKKVDQLGYASLQRFFQAIHFHYVQPYLFTGSCFCVSSLLPSLLSFTLSKYTFYDFDTKLLSHVATEIVVLHVAPSHAVCHVLRLKWEHTTSRWRLKNAFKKKTKRTENSK